MSNKMNIEINQHTFKMSHKIRSCSKLCCTILFDCKASGIIFLCEKCSNVYVMDSDIEIKSILKNGIYLCDNCLTEQQAIKPGTLP